ncbi:hypothetical protein Ancab_032107 [Ancistrocladus abbreviatus]
MQNKPFSSLLLQLALILLLCSTADHATTMLTCPNCGHTPVPYPLSTSPTCGHQSYKVRCNEGTLWLDTLNGSSYAITSITPQSQRLTIRPQSFIGNTCVTTDLYSGGLWLDDNLPFNICSNNTILKFNCAQMALKSSMNCSSNSICNRYIEETKEAAARCGEKLCCSYTTGGSQDEYRINLATYKCMAFKSFVDLYLDTSLPVSQWPEPALEIRWALPREPVCHSASDCRNLTESSCLADLASGGLKRCLCSRGHQWDPVTGICASLTYSACSIVVLTMFGILVYQQRQHVRREAQQLIIKKWEEILNADNNGKSAKLFSEKEIRKATNNFSKDNLLGSGGFGDVYKGMLNDGTLTAVKCAKQGNTKGTYQVLNEVRVLSQVNHRSLVHIFGCCVELEQPVLVCEYVPNGTLSDHLHGCHSGEQQPLTWQNRLKIAHQIAAGLEYLHFSVVPPILHRDIKSTNILLDEKLDARVSDFGLSRLVETDATHVSTCVQGTLGYLDPEYHRNFQLTNKSDVYSFGVVLLELLTSKKALDFSREGEEVSLVAYMRKMMVQDRLMDAIDSALEETACKQELESMKSLGLLAIACLDENRHNRPSMKEVAEEIEYIIGILNNEAS